MNIFYSGKTDIGLKRAVNQDSIALFESKERSFYLFAVADGMGGYSDGEMASHMITDGLYEWADEICMQHMQLEIRQLLRSLRSKIAAINSDIFTRYNQSQVCGSTCTILLIYQEVFAVVQAGDSRVYLSRGKQVEQILKDDVWDNQLTVQKLFSEEARKRHPDHGKLTNCIGTEGAVELSVVTDALKSGDSFLLCSDGLYKYCPEEYYFHILHAAAPNRLDQEVSKLIRKVYENNAKDNISVILVKCL